MDKSRVEAFTDALLAIIMTVLVLDLVAPNQTDWHALEVLEGSLAIYAMSFFSLSVYWVNHHHLFQMAEKVNGQILWSNILSIFLVSLVPFVTSWVGKDLNALAPCITYGILFLLINLSYTLLSLSMRNSHSESSRLNHVFGTNKKLIVSFLMNLFVVGLAFIQPWLVLLGRMLVSLYWVVPNKHAERCSENEAECYKET